VVAKQIATIDQIGHGRAGLNIVAGWNKPEYEALGLTLPDDHETRYAYAQEWFDLIRKLWTSTTISTGTASTSRPRVKGDPAPLRGSVPIINAAGSPQGREFATDNANFLFTPAIDLDRSKAEIAELKAQAKAKNRNVNVLTFSHVICRPTEKEAKDYAITPPTRTPTGTRSTTWSACNSPMPTASRMTC
jgi:dimethylsulfone monooxygenase